MSLFKNRKLLITALTLAVGFSAALVLPWLANAQSQTVGPELHQNPRSAPDALARYYVAKSGDGSDGLGWTTAFTNVQDALAKAYLIGDAEIWVAAGVYYPDDGANQTDNELTSTFIMTDNVALYGGFDTDAIEFSDRDWKENVTVLSGDIDGNDISDVSGIVLTTTNIVSDNAYHVVTARGVTGTAVIDGFTITGGKAAGSSPDDSGGGFFCDAWDGYDRCNMDIRNVTFSGNTASRGGALFIYLDGGRSYLTLNDVVFSGNSASSGGAIYLLASDGYVESKFTNIAISGNSAVVNGGGMYSLSDNSRNNPILVNVLFSGNKAGESGGAVYQNSPYSTIRSIFTNVTFSGNRAGDKGGAIYNKGAGPKDTNPTLRNSILWNNQDSSGTGTISATIYNDVAAVTVTHSLVQGTGASGAGIWLTDPSFVDDGNNIDEDPLFITPVSPTTAPTMIGNMRLQSVSPAIDKGFNGYITGVLSDLDGKPRVVDGDSEGTPTVDMGAYEYQIPYKYDSYLPFIYQ